MLDFVRGLCGIYANPQKTLNPRRAVEYHVALTLVDGRDALRISVEYADGRTGAEVIPLTGLDETEREMVDLQLRTLAKLKSDWSFSPTIEDDAVDEPKRRISVFDIEEEVSKFFTDTSKPTGDEPELVVIIGPVCAGKSTLRKLQFADQVLIDAGVIFQNLSRGEFYDFGAVFEEPLHAIGGEIARRAIRERRNVVTEMIGLNFDIKGALLAAIKQAGYKPEFVVVNCDLETAQERNLNRGDNISAYFCEPYHYRWIMDALESGSIDDSEVDDEEETEDVDEPYFDRAFLPIRAEEAYIKYELLNFVRKVIAEFPVSSDELRKIAILMLALERLPRSTYGVDICVAIKLRTGERNTSVYALELSSDRFCLYTGGYFYTEGVGGDSYSDVLFECESGGYRDGTFDVMDLADWMMGALSILESGAVIEIQNNGDESAIDWNLDPDDDGFDELEERIRRWEDRF